MELIIRLRENWHERLKYYYKPHVFSALVVFADKFYTRLVPLFVTQVTLTVAFLVHLLESKGTENGSVFLLEGMITFLGIEHFGRWI